MASEYYGLNRGQSGQPSGASQPYITIGTSTGSTDIELRVDLTKGLTKNEIVMAVKGILEYLTQDRDKIFTL